MTRSEGGDADLDDEAVASLAKALSSPARIQIVRLLADETECRGVDVFSELPLAQSTVSEHLRVLKEAGVITARPMGNGTVYCIVPGVLQSLSRWLTGVSATLPVCSSGSKECS